MSVDEALEWKEWLLTEANRMKIFVTRLQSDKDFKWFEFLIQNEKLDVVRMERHQERLLQDLEDKDHPLHHRLFLCENRLKYFLMSGKPVSHALAFFQLQVKRAVPFDLLMRFPSVVTDHYKVIIERALMHVLALSSVLCMFFKEGEEKPDDLRIFLLQAHALRLHFSAFFDLNEERTRLAATFDEEMDKFFGPEEMVALRPFDIKKALVELTKYKPDPKQQTIGTLEKVIVTMSYNFLRFILELKNMDKETQEKERPLIPEFALAFVEFFEKVLASYFATAEQISKADPTFLAQAIRVLIPCLNLKGISSSSPVVQKLSFFQSMLKSADGYCGECIVLKKATMSCSRCNTLRYCGADCQKIDWPIHKQYCGKVTLNDVKAELCARPPWKK